MANGRFVKFALRVLLSVSALAGESAAQATFVVDFGIRGGAVATDSHQLVRACCGAGSVLGGAFAFNLEQLRGTIGPTIGVLLHDRAEVRFEAVRRRFGYRIENDMTSVRLANTSLRRLGDTSGNIRCWQPTAPDTVRHVPLLEADLISGKPAASRGTLSSHQRRRSPAELQ